MKSAFSFLIAAKRGEIAGLEQLALTSALVNATGRLIHALQRERGLSNLYLASQGQRWADERLAQTTHCDALQAEVRAAFDSLDTDSARAGHGTRLFGRIAYVLQGLDALPVLRQRVQTRQWNAARATDGYIRLIQGLLAVVFEAADSASDPGISRRLVALFNFMQGKEFAGQERATGSALFASGTAGPDGQQRLLHLIDSQERCLQVFADFASEPLREAWKAVQRHDTLASLERLRRILATSLPGGPLDTALSQVWFDACTAHMDAMKTVEDALAAELEALCRDRLQAAQHELESLRQWEEAGPALPGSSDFFGDSQAAPTPPVQGYGPQVDRSILELVHEQGQRLQQMGDELDTVRASLNERKLVERAKGLLMAHRQFSEHEAHAALRQMAMNQNRRLVDVAQAVLAMAEILPSGKR
ncbi:nitrate- and nitrite sensing domain-containing protein [Hydrogenophaga sp. RWCD_12]|uniref:nitrate- and nitrite sensing domain-containing protein n=1 Tax=Hydrogenophaga sp. RWCD_12 TaxID=3391190 RepID=UPI003985327A